MTGRGLTAATLCSGIGAPEAARPDFRWLWSAEIDDFPATVYAERLPGVEKLGDITSPRFIARAAACGPLDLLVAGTPCQAFSVAGRREGLADGRGNLTLRFAEIVHELRKTCGLRFVLWENVPGVLSDKTNAFGCL
ncbi:MAG: DNA cytosine methyltransferase, partial [Candidatus Polarisedimenticolia bacterium]